MIPNRIYTHPVCKFIINHNKSDNTHVILSRIMCLITYDIFFACDIAFLTKIDNIAGICVYENLANNIFIFEN